MLCDNVDRQSSGKSKFRQLFMDGQYLLCHTQVYVNVCATYILTHFVPDSDSHRSSTGGAVYIRWGRTTCPGNGTTLVYAGKYINASFNGKQRQPMAVMHVNELIQN